MIYQESNITLDFTGINKHFRFETCPAYQSLSGQSIKEIDFGWWDDSNQVLYLLELKNYTIPGLDNQKAEKLIENLWKKSVDTMIMLNSVWLSTPTGGTIASCLPVEITQKVKVKIYHLVKVDPSSAPLMMMVNQKLTNKFIGYKKLFNVAAFSIITHSQAQSFFPNIVK